MPNTSPSPTATTPQTLPIIAAILDAFDNPVPLPEGSFGGNEEFDGIVDGVKEVGEDDDDDSDDFLTKVGLFVTLVRSSVLLNVLFCSCAPPFMGNCPCRFSQQVSLT